MRIFFPIMAIAASCLATPGCEESNDDGTRDASADGGSDTDVDADADTDADAGIDAGSANAALVFTVDPYITPTPTAVVLADVADDADGVLLSAARTDGVRRIKVLTCLDEGATNTNPLTGEPQRICTLAPIANKEENGSFVYGDYENDAACVFDPTNAHAEVSAYYHVSKIYDLITAPEVGVFDLLPGRHFAGGEPVPLTVVVNYREPVAAEQASLPPTDVAFFLSHEYLAMGMSVFQGLPDIPGDVLAFGQGETTDFAESGQTIYHEFGHALTNATAALGTVFADSQGLTNQPSALNEGIANTLGFLGSDVPLQGAFLSDCSGYNYEFDAEGDSVFPDDATGHPVVDGNPVFSGNYDVYSAFVSDWGGSKAGFVRILLLALQDLAALNGDVAFADYTEAFLARLSSEGYGDREAEARALFDAHGMTTISRVADLTGCGAEELRRLYMGCAADEPWNSVMHADFGEGVIPFATAYVQNSAVVAGGASALTISARLVEKASSMTDPGDWGFRLLVRHSEPVAYTFDDSGVATAAYDMMLAPTIEPGDEDAGVSDLATWNVDGVSTGETIYFQFVNFGTSEGILAMLAVE